MQIRCNPMMRANEWGLRVGSSQTGAEWCKERDRGKVKAGYQAYLKHFQLRAVQTKRAPSPVMVPRRGYVTLPRVPLFLHKYS